MTEEKTTNEEEDDVVEIEEITECPHGDPADDDHPSPCLACDLIAFKDYLHNYVSERMDQLDSFVKEYVAELEQRMLDRVISAKNEVFALEARTNARFMGVGMDFMALQHQIQQTNPFQGVIMAIHGVGQDISQQIRMSTMSGMSDEEAWESAKKRHGISAVVRASDAKGLPNQQRVCMVCNEQFDPPRHLDPKTNTEYVENTPFCTEKCEKKQKDQQPVANQ